jgi:uncharacterized protein YbjT (DUF2867 family)
MHEPRPSTIAIAGASGFVGRQLVAALAAHAKVIALARAPRAATPQVEWRRCDLFSSTSVREAMRGADVAVYLVHSMMPSSRLFQGDFHDTDLLLADNFAKACVHAGVRRIVYLGGLVPAEGFVSKHLASRVEVEEVLRATGIATTCLRAGMVVGPGGSSFAILKSLVERLPWMVLPKWTSSASQAVFIDDVIAVLEAAVREPAFEGKTLDLVNGESLTYEALLRQTAVALGKKRHMWPVPIASTGFSKRWVQLFSRASYELVSPLIDSLQCDLPQVRPDPVVAKYIEYTTFASMLTETLRREAVEPRPGPSSRSAAPPSTTTGARERNTVCSIQRLPAMPSRDSRFLSNEYMAWLPQFFRPLIRVTRAKDSPRVVFALAFMSRPLLELEFIDQGADRTRDKFHIVGGILSKTTTTGWLEFRQIAHKKYTLAAIHGFVPSLPWVVYLASQAPVHAWVMANFGRHLARISDGEVDPVSVALP